MTSRARRGTSLFTRKTAVLAIALLAMACRSTEVKPADPETVIANSMEGGTTKVVQDAAASPNAASTAKGWMVRSERGTNPIYTDRAVVLEAMKKGTQRAVLVHDEKIEECSSTGGSHAFFTIVSGGKGIAHYGGHGAHLPQAFEKGQIWVASIEVLASPESAKNESFCVPDRVINARATAMVPVSSREEGVRLLEELAH
jgi:hypothetical protein